MSGSFDASMSSYKSKKMIVDFPLVKTQSQLRFTNEDLIEMDSSRPMSKITAFNTKVPIGEIIKVFDEETIHIA